MRKKIIKLSEHKPHLSVPLIDGNVMLVPARYIEEIIKGKQKLKITKDNRMLILSIIKEWYESIKKKGI